MQQSRTMQSDNILPAAAIDKTPLVCVIHYLALLFNKVSLMDELLSPPFPVIILTFLSLSSPICVYS